MFCISICALDFFLNRDILPYRQETFWQMKMVSAVLSKSTCLLLPFLAPIVFAQDAPTQCFVIDGAAADNSGYRCDNSTAGNSACCAAGATCYSNGLCKQDNGPTVDYLRVGCTDQTWENPACLNQCAACKYIIAGTESQQANCLADSSQSQMAQRLVFVSATATSQRRLPTAATMALKA